MRPRRLVWQLYVPLVLLSLAVLVAATFHTARTVHAVYLDQTRTGLEMAARTFAAAFRRPGRTDPVGAAATRRLVAQIPRPEGLRVTVISADGTVLADTAEDPRVMDNHGSRPEVLEALAKGLGSAVRYSKTVKRQMVYVALPLRTDGEALAGIVRTSLPLAKVHRELRDVYRRTFAAGALLAVLILPIAFFISRRISRPLEELGRSAARMALGERPQLRLARGTSREASELATQITEMAEELDSRLAAVAGERDQRTAILASMVEGVLVVDDASRSVLVMNAAAARLLQCEASTAVGKPLVQVARTHALQQFVDRVLASGSPLEDEIVIGNGQQRNLQLHGSRLADPAGRGETAVIVLARHHAFAPPGNRAARVRCQRLP